MNNLKYRIKVVNMTITDEQLKGNWAEQYIAANLASKGCLIRHVTQGHDIGIDLYCETTTGDEHLHFWCQIKTSKNWKGKRKHLSFKPPKRHKDYWLTQPVPVFIFLVPDLRDGQNIPYYICNAINLLDGNKINSDCKIENHDDLAKFLNKYLVFQTYLWDIKDGKVSYLKNPKNEYTKQFPSAIAHEFEPELLRSLLYTLWRLSQDILFQGINPKDLLNKYTLNNDEKKRFETAKPYMKALEILVLDKNDEQWQNYATMGVYYELEKDYNTSIECYEKSLSIINSDKNLNKNEDPWKNTIKDIEGHIERVKSKMQMPSDSLVD